MKFLPLLLSLCFAAGEGSLADVKTPLLQPKSNASSPKPHLFLVLVDDLGWSNVGFRASGESGSCVPEEAVTPTLDKLMKQGILLNRHYTYNYCSPTRSALQSGRLPVHVSELNDDPTFHNPRDPVSGFSGSRLGLKGVHMSDVRTSS